MRDVVIVGAARTPIGAFWVRSARSRRTKLGATRDRGGARARRRRARRRRRGATWACVLPAGVGQAPARQAALGRRAAEERAVHDGQQGVRLGPRGRASLGAQAIAAGETDVVVAGGMESMSNAPHVLPRPAQRRARWARSSTVDSMITDGLWDPYSTSHMGNCAELCAKEKNISRGAQDEFAAESYRRALDGAEGGSLQGRDRARSRSPQQEGRRSSVDDRRGARRAATSRSSPSLRAAFQKDGTITAGNASSINDGAAALVLMAADEAQAARREGARAASCRWG